MSGRLRGIFFFGIFVFSSFSFAICENNEFPPIRPVKTNFFEKFNKRVQFKITGGQDVPKKLVPKEALNEVCPKGKRNCKVQAFNTQMIPKSEVNEIREMARAQHKNLKEQLTKINDLGSKVSLGEQGAIIFVGREGKSQKAKPRFIDDAIKEALMAENHLCNVSVKEDGEEYHIVRMPYVKVEEGDWVAYLYCSLSKCQETEKKKVACGLIKEKICAFGGEISKLINFGPSCACREEK